ncbi:MAG: DUF4115 domain-containing protein [Rickettsiales bacterium]|jgi:cytoskeletal protein RodZ|nr:DUF4115 domain-containing protein [Rickettsiales bacterium]
MNGFTSEELDLTAGQMLRQARTTGRRKRELNTVARVLCIREEFLEAFENDDFSKIPELVYILGFARNYAMELDLDPYVIVDKIKKQMGLVEEQDAIEIEGEEPPSAADRPLQSAKGGQWLRRNKIKIAVSAAMLSIAGSGAMLVMLNQPPPPVPAASAPATPETKYNLPVGREYGARNRDYAPIVLQATGTAWMQIKNATGNVVFEHSMAAGDVYYALTGSIATIGNAGAVDVWVNGREIPKLGAERQRVLDVLLTPENLIK